MVGPPLQRHDVVSPVLGAGRGGAGAGGSSFGVCTRAELWRRAVLACIAALAPLLARVPSPVPRLSWRFAARSKAHAWP